VQEAFGLDWHLSGKPVFGDSGKYSAFLLVDRFKTILESHNKTQPLFVYLPFQDVHEPLQGFLCIFFPSNRSFFKAPESYIKKYANILNNDRKVTAGMVSVLDEAIGNVTALWKKHGFEESERKIRILHPLSLLLL